MSEETGSGAPYHIIVTLPNNNEVRTYECADKEITLDDLTTLALVHINENIRGRTGVRTLFEIVSAPREVEDGSGGSSGDIPGADGAGDKRVDSDRNLLAKEEVKDDPTDPPDRADGSGE